MHDQLVKKLIIKAIRPNRSVLRKNKSKNKKSIDFQPERALYFSRTRKRLKRWIFPTKNEEIL